MPWRRLLLLPVLAGLTASVAGALSVSSLLAPGVMAPAPTAIPRPDGAAAATLDRAIAALTPPQPRWVQAAIWQKVHVPYLDFQADGTYQSGPGRRLRLDLQVHTSALHSQMRIVSDGQTLWQERQVPALAPTATRIDLGKVLPLLEHPQAPPAARERFLAEHFFTGPEPLLSHLRGQVAFTRQERVCWRDRDAWLLTGVRRDVSLPDCPHYFPRQCRLYLDAATLWPQRLEWWGPAPKRKGDILISEMELRQPVFDRPLHAELFAYRPGVVPVADVTGQWTAALTPSPAQ